GTAAAHATSAPSIPTGATKASMDAGGQQRFTPRFVTGHKAVDDLGHNIHEVADRSLLTATQLKNALLADDTLQVSEDGTVQVADALGGTGATIATGSSNTLLWPVANTLYLHSRASSPR